MHTSYQTTTIAQALESLVQLPDAFDVQKNLPTVTVNAHELVNSVAMLWNAMKDQRGFLQTVEKEMSRRKTEMEVRFQKMQSDVDGAVTQEARKRQAEDERLRQEMAAMRDELQKHMDAARRESKESQEAFQRSIDRTVSGIKASVAEVQERVTDLSTEVSNLKDEVSRLKSDRDTLQQLSDKTRSDAQSQFQTICNFIGVSPMVVQQSVANGTEKDAMLKTPALQTLAQRIRMADDKAENAKSEAAKVASETQQLSLQVTKIAGDLTKLDLTVNTMDQMLREAMVRGDDKLSQRIDLLERGVNAQLAHLSKNNSGPATVVTSVPTDGVKKGEIEGLRSAFEQLKHDVGTRIAAKADQSDVHSAIQAIHATLDRHEEEIAKLQQGQGIPPAVMPTRRESLDSDTPKMLSDLASRLAEVERRCDDLQDSKADRSEVRLGLSDLAKKMETALAELYQQLQSIRKELIQQHQTTNPYPPVSQDATAGRFRCISCNRDAGPLQEQIQERLSKSQFPPSPMIVSQAGAQSSRHNSQGGQSGGSIIQSRQPVPGLREYGGTMTSSRKKLMNYYVWLQDKNDNAPSQSAKSRPTSAGRSRDAGEVAPTNGSATTPRSRSPGSQHPWAGAQSGNGTFGERQCGDHGTPEPEAVGIDGKYYVGVTGSSGNLASTARPRPTSAPARGRAPAPTPPVVES